MGRTTSILLALVAGLISGIALRVFIGHDTAVAGFLQPVGELWLNALRMTLVPLVFCLMTAGVASLADTAAGSGKQVGIAVAVFLTLLVAASVVGAGTAEALMTVWPVKPIDVALAAHSAAGTATPPNFVSVLVGLIPLNPVAAAAEAAMAPLIVFAAIFGIAISRLPSASRRLLVDFFKASADAMLIIVNWVLSAAPIGIFILTLEAAANVGVGLALGLVQYVLLLSTVLAVGLICATLIGLSSGRPTRFLRAALGPQALAASTQSSMACLPSLMQAAETLELPGPFVATIMPLAVTTFRFGNVFGGVAAGLIGAHLFGIHPGISLIVLAIAIGVLTNVGVLGLPGQAVLFAAYGPIFAALGTPIEALTLLIAVFTLPDILDTTCNVTADLAATVLIARLARLETERSPRMVKPADVDTNVSGT